MSCCGKKQSCSRSDSPFSKKGLLTVGMATFDDFDGVYFSTQALLMYHKDVLPHLELMVVDNNPDSPQGKETQEYCSSIGATYVEFTMYEATAVKELVFEYAKTPYVLCMDSHVLVEPGAIKRLLMYYQCHEDTPDLLQGPLLPEDITSTEVWTHFDPRWRNSMFGTWAADPRGQSPDREPFEIPMQGMGLFSCRREAWPGYSPHFRGFGGEEWYIHQKFRQRGARTLCLPFLRWSHRFRRPNGAPYRVCSDDKIRNYYIGFLELGENPDTITNYFRFEVGISQSKLDGLLFEARCLVGS